MNNRARACMCVAGSALTDLTSSSSDFFLTGFVLSVCSCMADELFLINVQYCYALFCYLLINCF
jgi:hypothetical protein